MQTLDSQVTLVTVFPNRAQVLRTATIDLPAGEHWLVFDNLPTAIDQKSVQVNGIGKAVLTKVQFQQVFLQTASSEEAQQLQEKKQAQELVIRQQNEKIKRLQKQKEMLDGIAKKITNPTETVLASDLNPTTWLEMLTFYQNQLTDTDTQILETEQIKKKEEDVLHHLNWQLQQISSQASQRKNQVVVGVEMREQASLTLTLAYIVTHASWTPVYDLRVSAENKQMQIVYKAIVQQQTGEAWENTELRLSTAQPAISGQQPTLSPWRIDFYVAPKPAFLTGGIEQARQMFQPAALTNMMPVPEMEEALMDFEDDETPMDVVTASVETKSTSVFFNIAGKHTVKSDSTDHQVTIMQSDFSAHFRYSTVPKLSTYAYLKVKVKNETPYPFLAGETNVFLDGNFVAHARMGAVAPTEEFWTFLGIDESMKVEYKFLKKYEKKEGGMFTKKVRIWVHEYLITLKNHKSTTEELVVWDQLPISGSEQIKVHLLEPTFKENSDKLKKNELEYLEWFFLLKPSEEVQIPFKFSVEYPQDMAVSGL
jgi:uncharacterized protein (TIGR02231 family)